MAILDHMVINALRGMDAAAASFTALGFTLTPLGRHTLGSINHLMMTPGAYLELVGVPVDGGRQRPEVLDSPFGLNGLVLRSDDADATFDRLNRAGARATPPVAFSRPVEIDGRQEEASFRTVRLDAAAFPAGRVYYCQHLTPQFVWRDDWLTHANTFCGFDRMVVTSPDPDTDAQAYALACESTAERGENGWSVPIGDFIVDIVAGPAPRFHSLGLLFSDLGELERRAVNESSVRWKRLNAEEAVLELPDLELILTCRTAA
ncbi:VOC family protein [Terrihabitans sp. B22-R8]|uniref:VOC family protein n=1 Tax=Terrihabitans sp. B22-R8 TaxID=3425128 RepID=UPI00403C55A5